MKIRKINYKNLGLVIMIVLIITLICLLPLFHNYGNEYRQQFGINNGYGGEFLIPLFPLMYLLFYYKEEK